MSVVLAIIGIVLSLYLIQFHYELKAGQTGWCDLSSFINCDSVMLSGYSELVGIPLGAFGAAWFAIFLVLRLSDKLQNAHKWLKENINHLLILWCILGLSFVSLLVYIELVILKSICILCTSTHVLVLSISLLLFLELRRGQK